MIQNYEDYTQYLQEDQRANRYQGNKPQWIFSEIWVFLRLLRKVEYLKNCKPGLFWKIRYRWASLRYHYLGMLVGFEIPINTFGPGLSISHKGFIVVHPKARIGANCRIHQGVTIGTEAGTPDNVPTIGNNVFIGPNAVIVGKIKIANNILIGANTFVNQSFLEENITLAGCPAKKTSNKGRLELDEKEKSYGISTR